MRNTADVIGGKPIAVLLQSISGVSAINSLVTFCKIHGGKREVLFFYFVPEQQKNTYMKYDIKKTKPKLLNKTDIRSESQSRSPLTSALVIFDGDPSQLYTVRCQIKRSPPPPPFNFNDTYSQTLEYFI
jgi:hypothetical protein